jgi:hypothetical protein
MTTAREFGKIAKKNEINAPTLDEKFLHWLVTIGPEKKIDNFVQWWEGWYEALDESLSLQTGKFSKHIAQSCSL